MTRGIGVPKPQGVVSLDHIDTRGRPCRQFSGRPEDVDALVDICLRATVTARVANKVTSRSGTQYTIVILKDREA